MSQKQKTILGIFFAFILFSLLKPSSVFAQKERFAININPVRGSDFWKNTNSPNHFVEYQKKIAIDNNFSVTWLIRPDYFLSKSENIFLNPEYKNDDLGIFLEVTPSWTKINNIEYKTNLPWYHSQNIFLSGYNQNDRLRLIDTAMDNFKQIYGFYPKSVGAWHIDSFSAEYLVNKYDVNNFLICSDQTSTDGYQIWGGWWGIPYFPSKNNLLIPAKSKADKLNAVVLFWALRDPLNGYGGGSHSLYSLQSNDYSYLKLNTDYSNKLVDIYLNQTTNDYGQVTIGLENDDLTHNIEYQDQIRSLAKKDVKFITSSQFYSWYSQKYPKLTPDTEIYGQDPLGTNQEFKWILSKYGRMGLFKDPSQEWFVKDLRYYSDNDIDPYRNYRNTENVLNWKITPRIDSVFNVGNTIPYNNQIKFKPSGFKINFKIIFSVIITLITIMFSFKKNKIIPTLTILAGTIVLSLTMIRSGLFYDFGLGYWGPNGHDGIWHLSLINQLQQNIPPLNPVFSGTTLTNYHWGFDLFAAFLGKLFNNNSFVYFQFLPIIFGLIIGYLSFKLVNQITKNQKLASLFTFLIYFSGSFGWLYTLIKSGNLGGESLFWSMQSVSTLINPPFALSLIILLWGLIIWSKNNSSDKYKIAVINGIIFGILSGIKVYAGILAGLTLVIFWFFDFLKTRKVFNYNFFTWATTLIISLIILGSLGVLKSSSILEFKPLWFTHSMVESIDKFYFPKLAAYRINLSQNLNPVKLPFYLGLEASLVLIFIVGNLGFRVLGLIPIFQKIKNHHLTSFEKLILILMGLALIIPLLFVQKGTAWNTIQFFYYFLFFSNIFFAQFITDFLKIKSKKNLIIIIFILILTNLTSISTIKDYLGNPPPSAIPAKEVEALNFLKNQKNGIVLTYPYDQYIKNKLKLSTPIPMYLYETTAYVSAYSNKISFLEDEMNLDITGFNWEKRKNEVINFFQSNEEFAARGFLVNNQIDYIYLINGQKITLGESQLQINKIFDNGQIQIYQVQR
ncbi:MAG: hypothetical protein KIH89_004835 [Candidatus Shapirobacteria bacterium]|nr:hypothetical protein [Candidatus Shapirobacteria bacterium]